MIARTVDKAVRGRLNIMKIKRPIAIGLVICLISSFAVAEDDKGSVLELLRNAWDETKTWTADIWNEVITSTDDAWNNVKHWVGNTWGSASEWVEKTWNSSSDWIFTIWGDTSTWISDEYDKATESVSAWWVDTFNDVTEKTDVAMEWVGKESEVFRSTLNETYKNITSTAKEDIANTGESIKSTYEELLRKLNFSDIEIEKIIETINEYAAMIGLPVGSIAVALLPYLVKLVIQSTMTGKSIPAVAVAMFLTAVIDKLDITTERQAEQLVNGFVEHLDI